MQYMLVVMSSIYHSTVDYIVNVSTTKILVRYKVFVKYVQRFVHGEDLRG